MSRRTAILAVATGVAATVVAGCAAPGPGAPGYPFNVSGTYRGTLTLDGREHAAVVEMRTCPDGTVAGSLRIEGSEKARGDFSGTISDDTLVWRSSFHHPELGCGGVARGVGAVARGGGSLGGTLRVDGSCRGARTGRFELARPGPEGA